MTHGNLWRSLYAVPLSSAANSRASSSPSSTLTEMARPSTCARPFQLGVQPGCFEQDLAEVSPMSPRCGRNGDHTHPKGTNVLLARQLNAAANPIRTTLRAGVNVP